MQKTYIVRVFTNGEDIKYRDHASYVVAADTMEQAMAITNNQIYHEGFKEIVEWYAILNPENNQKQPSPEDFRPGSHAAVLT
jgi:hypothetical protein